MRTEIIRLLKQSEHFVSGEEMSRKLKMSRAGIWKHIQDLRRQGYVIEASPRAGYRLVSVPDKLTSWEIQEGLATKYLGREIFCFDTINSTMDEASRLATLGAPEGAVVCADTQTCGRGRMGRSWISPKGKGVYFSIILRPTFSLNEVAKLTLMTAVSVCERLRDISGVDVRIKWPNDLLVAGKKIAGILTELAAETDRVKFVVVGVGINVNIPARQIPDHATSLKVETQKTFSRVQVLQEILRGMERQYDRVKEQGFAPVFKEWRELSMTLGQRVCLLDGGNRVEGIAVNLADDGGLLIRDQAGNTWKKMSGDLAVMEG